MKRIFHNLFFSLPIGPRILLFVFALSFPLAWGGSQTRAFDLYGWLGLSPALVWSGQIWRMISYGFLPLNVIDWAVGLFWLATLVSILGRDWSSLEFWVFCSCGILGGALPFVILKASSHALTAGNAAMILALLVAWDWFHRRERLLLLGIGEVSVRQAAIGIAILNSIIALFSCGGWFAVLSIWCGGLAGWIYLTIQSKRVMGRSAQHVRSGRAAKLEL